MSEIRCAARSSGSARSRAPVAVVVHAYFEEDARVRRKVDALVAAGHPVEVFALRRPADSPLVERDGVRIHHLDVTRHQGAGLATYVVEYVAFLVRAAIALTRAHRRRRFALVDVNTLPDYLVFAAVPLRVVGIPVLLDLHEAMPEFFESRFPGASNPFARAALRLQERASIAVASAVVTVNASLAKRLTDLGVAESKVTVVLNSPSTELFNREAHPHRTFMADGRLRLIYAGALTPIYELDVVLQAVARLATERPELDVGVSIYGRGDSEPMLRELATTLGIADRVELPGRVELEAIPSKIAAADIGLAPTRRDAFTERSLSTKIFEYAAMGKPVVASNLPTVRHYFADGAVALYRSGDPDDLARAILEVVDGPAARDAMNAASAERLAELGWERQAERYIGLVERLIAGRGRPEDSRGDEARGVDR